MRLEPEIDIYHERLAAAYEDLNYGTSLSAYFMRRSHELLERAFDERSRFGRVVEVGAGGGQHLRFIRHGFDEYYLTDQSTTMLEGARARCPEALRSKIRFLRQDATRLTLDDASVDRLVAMHVLEHLYRPHEVLREWDRVVRPGGVLSIVLPCDPGLLWRLGRILGPRANAERAGIEYDYWMAREHVNPINNLVVFIRYYFDAVRELWYPTRIPSMDLNLFYVSHIFKEKNSEI